MKVTSSTPFPDHSRPTSGTGQAGERANARSLTTEAQRRNRPAAETKAVSRPEPVKTPLVDPTQSSGSSGTYHQRPVRISREGEAEAVFVYDSLAQYDPKRGRPRVDVYV